MLLKITYFEKEERIQALGICICISFFFLFFETVELLNASRTCILSVIIKFGKFIYLTFLSLTFSLFYFKATISLAFVMGMKLRSVFIIYLFVYEVEYGCLYFSC